MSDTPAPVTVGELLAALATYPRDALVFAFAGVGSDGAIEAEADGVSYVVWDGVTTATRHDWGPDAEFFENGRPKPMDVAPTY